MIEFHPQKSVTATITQDGVKVGFVVLHEADDEQGHDIVFHLMAAEASPGLIDACEVWALEAARVGGYDGIRFLTVRQGLVRKMMAHGWQKQAFQMRRAVAHG